MKTNFLLTISILIFSMNTLSSFSFPMTFEILKSHPINRNNISLRFLDHLSNLKGNSSPIFGNSTYLNYYYVDLYIGEPSQKQSVIIDTGSHITAVPCLPHCKKCGKHLNEYYDMSKSNHSKIINCEDQACKGFGYSLCSENKQCGFEIVIKCILKNKYF